MNLSDGYNLRGKGLALTDRNTEQLSDEKKVINLSNMPDNKI